MGMVSDTMTCFITDLPMRSSAGPLKSACVQHAETCTDGRTDADT